MQIITYLAVNLLVGLVSLHSYAHEFWMDIGNKTDLIKLKTLIKKIN